MLPPFRGLTRRIILFAAGFFLLSWILEVSMYELFATVMDQSMLHPRHALHGLVFQFFTYPFVSFSLLATAFSLLAFWFFGSVLEDEQGSLWFGEFLLVATVAGAILASLLTFAHIPGIDPDHVRTSGMWPIVTAVMLAYARFHPNEPIRLYFVLSVKAKHLVALYLLFYFAVVLIGGDKFGALTAISVSLCGYVYLRWAPRKGLRWAVSERWYALRNDYYRSKRRKAAKKFAVYMKKQGKDVSIDESGRYVDPSGTPRDPNDRRWMN